jgi:flagellar basal body-associated protein FliL
MAEDAVESVVAGDDEVSSEGAGGKLLPLLLCVSVVLVGAVGGFAARMLLGGAPAKATAEAEKPGIQVPETTPDVYSYYDLEQITVNANVPQRNRHICAEITFAFHPEVLKEIQKDLDAKQPEIKNWVMRYLSGLSLEDVGDQGRVCNEIQDEVNQKLWPGQDPVIHHVLMRKFAIQ